MRLLAAFLALAAACDDGPASYGDPLDDPQLPPRGHDDLLTWLEAGHYLAWSCESGRHPPSTRSGHGANRICSNRRHETHVGGGPFPEGAASVKEVYTADGRIRLYAVYRKVEAGTGGDRWYWFEGSRDDTIANGEGDSTCTGCHAGAPNDYVFTVVRAP